ncbi:hypothetical protein PYCC9005_004602 [Savitreella phatthalungensis]
MLRRVLASASPRDLTFADLKPIIRCAIASWIGLVLLLINPVVQHIGQASYLVLFIGCAQPASGPIIKTLYDGIFTVVFVCISWAWWVVVSRCATAARGTGLSLEDFLRTSDCTTEACVSDRALNGEFVDARSSLVYIFLLGVGVTFWLWIKVKFPARLISVIFGLVALIVSTLTGGLYPYFLPTFTRTVFYPIAIQTSISILAACLIFPQTMNYLYVRQLRGTIGKIKEVARAQQAVLEAPITCLEDWRGYAGIKAQVGGLRASLAGLAPNSVMLDQEIHFSRLRAADLRLLTLLCRDVVLKAGGFSLFYDLVEETLTKHESDSKPPSRPSTQPTSRANSHDSPHSIRTLLHDALHHRYKPVAVFEMYRYDQWQSRFPHTAEVSNLLRMLALCGKSTGRLSAAVEAALDAAMIFLEKVNDDRFGARLLGRKIFPQDKLLSERALELGDAIAAWHAHDRMVALRPYEDERSAPHRPLLRMMYVQFHIGRYAESVLKLVRACHELETSKSTNRARWHLPSSLGSWHAAKGRPSAPVPQEDYGIVEQEDELEFETEVRDPDADPPRNVFHLLGRSIVSLGQTLRHDHIWFAIRGGVLVGIVAIPAFLSSSAGWFYRNKGLWAVIMAAFSLAPYNGETAFTFVWRVVGTFTGAVTGLALWYVGNGGGGGQPYGFAAIMAIAFPFIQYVRQRWVFKTPQPAIIYVMTIALIIGYSWQNTHVPSQYGLGHGWPVAWRRFVVVCIGISAAFLWSFIPPVTGRQVLRRRLAASSHTIGRILMAVSNFARHSHQTRADEEIIRGLVTDAQARLVVLDQRLVFVSFEPPLSGPWPKHHYVEMLASQRQLLDLLVTFCNILVEIKDERWKKALLSRAGWRQRELAAGALSSLFMAGNAVRTGRPLPQININTLDKFYQHIAHVQDHRLDGALPSLLTKQVLEDREYALFAVGSVVTFAIYQRIDGLMRIAKELVGEQWPSLPWEEGDPAMDDVESTIHTRDHDP